MNRILFLISVFTVLSITSVHAQQLIDLPIAPRVDTTNTEVKAVYKLWRAYLSNNPQNITDNPYWSEKQKRNGTIMIYLDGGLMGINHQAVGIYRIFTI